MTRYALVLIAAAAGSLSTASTVAFATTEVRTARVSYADLDLSRDAGVERLYARLKAAAESTCGQADNRDLGALADQQRCVSNALRRAVQQVHSERLSALYLADTSKSRPAEVG